MSEDLLPLAFVAVVLSWVDVFYLGYMYAKWKEWRTRDAPRN